MKEGYLFRIESFEEMEEKRWDEVKGKEWTLSQRQANKLPDGKAKKDLRIAQAMHKRSLEAIFKLHTQMFREIKNRKEGR